MAVYKALNATTYVTENSVTINDDFANPYRGYGAVLKIVDNYYCSSFAAGTVTSLRCHATTDDLDVLAAPDVTAKTLSDGTTVYGLASRNGGMRLRFKTSASGDIGKAAPGKFTILTATQGGTIQTHTLEISLSSVASSEYVYITFPFSSDTVVLLFTFTPDETEDN